MSYAAANLSEVIADMVQARSQHVVRVEGRPRHASSGIVWSREGLIVTANYAVEFEDQIAVGLPGGERVPAELIGRDPGTDVALLRVHGVPLNPAPWGSVDGVRLGHMVLMLARPGRTPRTAMGVVSTLSGQWQTPYGGLLDRYIQTDCLTRPGYSGGLLVDVQGRTIGMITAGLLHRDHIIVTSNTLRQAVSRILTAPLPEPSVVEEEPPQLVDYTGVDMPALRPEDFAPRDDTGERASGEAVSSEQASAAPSTEGEEG